MSGMGKGGIIYQQRKRMKAFLLDTFATMTLILLRFSYLLSFGMAE